jgi:hypothetical protein
MYRSESAFFLRDFRRVAAEIYPALVKTTAKVAMTATTKPKAMTVGMVPAITDDLLPRINLQFNFAVSSRYQPSSCGRRRSNLPALFRRSKSSYCRRRDYGPDAGSVTIGFYFKLAV